MPDKSFRCMLEVTAVPWQAFRLPDDGARPQHVCSSRRSVLIQLARYANPDGTQIWPSLETLCKDTGLCRRLIIYRLNDLVKLGFLINGKQRGRNGSRNRAIDMAKVRAAKQGNESEINSAKNTETVQQTVQHSAETVHSGALQQCNVPPETVHTACTLPPVLDRQHTALPTPKNGWEGFVEKLPAMMRKALDTLGGKGTNRLQASVAKMESRAAGLAAATVNHWCTPYVRPMPVEGLTKINPWWAFLKEYPNYMTEAFAKTPEGRAAEARRQEEAVEAAAAFSSRLAREALARAEALADNESLEETVRKLKELSK